MTDAERRTEEELFILFRMLTADTRHQLEQIVAGYYTGSVTAWQLSDALVTALSASHAHAAYLGRRLAGNRAPFGTADQQFAASVVIGQGQYLRGLVSDILTGRYPLGADSTLSAALIARLGMYADALRRTAEESWSLNLPEDTLINWVLSAVPENHCDRCPEIAANGPYPANAMPTYPGSGELPCMSNCLCHLETVDGQTCFLANQ